MGTSESATGDPPSIASDCDGRHMGDAHFVPVCDVAAPAAARARPHPAPMGAMNTPAVSDVVETHMAYVSSPP